MPSGIPSADIEGADACRKICILAALAFGRHVYPDQVPTEGITQITALRDVAIAAAAELTRQAAGPRRPPGRTASICAYVAPHLVPEEHTRWPMWRMCSTRVVVARQRHRRSDVLWPGRRQAAHCLRCAWPM